MRYTGVELAAVTTIIQDTEKLNVKNISIPFSFLKENNIVLSEKEVDFAISRKIIDLQDLGKIVDVSLINYPDSQYLLEIALNILLNGSYLNPYVQYLEIDYSGVNREDGTIIIDDERVNDRLRYIILLWLFKNRLNSDADFDKVNSVYDDFSYPSDMIGFISYMPTKESGNKRMSNLIYSHWQIYLETYSYLLKT
ncbi:DUF2247 family protein [Psychrobacter urativorans]|uniref:Uncharacterized protein n=1 Tax=Psychrobacter urativorans TaxID=45610 RepID=A0A0M3V9G6_9GAMM|nr:DUF2247 family protein [Psychrobacter urativorans]ALF60891.1 hypothetical protein AOC03_11915 [Psychrobacter urativorans]ALF60903.1 hypothetical protein AOC03_11975 [Psychrobacter urativorans]